MSESEEDDSLKSSGKVRVITACLCHFDINVHTVEDHRHRKFIQLICHAEPSQPLRFDP